MKKLIYLLPLLLIATPCFGQDMARMSLGIVGGGVPAAGGCTSGDLAHETFDAAGYDLGGAWSESIGGAGALVNEDLAAPALTGFSGQSLRTYINSTFAYAYGIWTDSSSRATVYSRFYFYVNAENLADPDTTGRQIYKMLGGANEALRIRFCKAAGGQLYLSLMIQSIERDTYNISVQTSYCIEVYASNAGGTWEWKIDGVSAGSGANDPGYDINIHYLGIVTADADNHTIDLYFDKFDVSATGWLGVCP